MLDSKFLEFVATNYGLPGVILIIIALFLIKVKNPCKYIGKIKKIFHIQQNTTPEQLLLSKLDYWIQFKIPNLKMKDAARQQIFRDVLKFKFNAFRTMVKDVSSKINEDQVGSDIFQLIVFEFNEAIDEYEKKSIEYNIPEAVMVKYSDWQNPSYEYTIRAIELICTSNGYGSNKTRLNAVYSLITAMMELTVAQAERTLTELNGQLSGVEYKGLICT